VIHRTLRNRGFGQIPVTCRAENSRLVMRFVAEFDMSVGREAVDVYPGDLKVLVSVSNDFLYSRFFSCQLGMTEHALSDRWKPSGIANVGANMAIDTLHSKLHMSVVRECDGLLGPSGNGPSQDEP
jgi:hypothetical protein